MTEIRTLGSREVFANPWLRLREDAIEYRDGTTGVYTVLEKPDFVTVVPWTGDGFWLVEQFRYPVGRREWEFPQGGWPAGHGGTPAELAATELAEETGLQARELRHLGNLYAAVGYSSQRYDVFVATGLTEGAPDREHSEADMVHRWVPEAELHAMIRDGRFVDSHCLAALTLFELDRRDS